VGRNNEATQGISTRSKCPVYLAVKTEVLAIHAAFEERDEGDFYVTDLFDIFRFVLERSEFKEAIWKSPLGNWEHQTPFAYLLYQISGDLWDLASTALQTATPSGTPAQAETPGQVAQDLAPIWSLCIWVIADSENNVSPDLRRHIIQQYLIFVLALGWAPSEIYVGSVGSDVEGLDVCRDLFSSELQDRFTLSRNLYWAALKDATESLGQGKGYVQEGFPWFEETLFGTNC